MKTFILIYVALITVCLGGHDESISIGYDGWDVELITVGGYGENRDEVVTRVSLSHEDHPLSAIFHLPLSHFYTLWRHLEMLPKSKVYKRNQGFKEPAKFVYLSSHNHVFLEPTKALPLVMLWLDTHRGLWTTPTNKELIKEAQGPHHERLQSELRDGFFPPSVKKILQSEQDGADQPATALDSKPKGNLNPKPKSEVRPQ